MASDGEGDVPPPPPPPPPAPALPSFVEEPHEVYPGERDDSEYLAVLISEEEQPDFSKIMEAIEGHSETDSPGEDTATNYSSFHFSSIGGTEPLVMPIANNRDHSSLSPQQHRRILEDYLQNDDWENLLQHLTVLVGLGYADKAVEDAVPGDIYKAHPELVILILRQRYMDLRRAEQIEVASAFYRESILAYYPDDSSTGSTFVDRTILEVLRAVSRSIDNPVGDGAEERAATHQAINDYLQLYFPAYRPNVQGSGRPRSRVWELGEKIGRNGRCLACHRLFVGLNVTKLRQHLDGVGRGHVGRCIAVNEHVRRRLRDILALERGPEDAVAAIAGPPSSPTNSDDAEDNQGAAATAAVVDNQGEAATDDDEANESGAVLHGNAGNQEDVADNT